MFRGTIRYAGFCRLLGGLADMGFLAEKGKSARGVSSSKAYCESVCGASTLKQRLDICSLLREVGLFNTTPLTGAAATADSPIDVEHNSHRTPKAKSIKK